MNPIDPKLQALIDNQLGKIREGSDSLSQLFGFRWEPAPEGFVCPHCAGALERSASLMQMSPWAGSVRCTVCAYKHTVCGYLGEQFVMVEPLPPDGDPDVVDAILSEDTKTTQWHPACIHVEADECHCRCHIEPILHDKACCSPCLRCGFRTVEL